MTVQPGFLRITCDDGTAASTYVEVMQDDRTWRRLTGIISADIHVAAGGLVEVGLKAYAHAGLSLVGHLGTRVEVEPCPCGLFAEPAPAAPVVP